MSKKQSKSKPEQLNKVDIVNFLKDLNDEDFIEVLQSLFEIKRPDIEPDTFNQDKYFLGIASRRLESQENGSDYWGPWTTQAVGYVDAESYEDGIGLGSDLGQGGYCTRCRTDIRANAKHSVCPICGAKLYLT